MFGNFKWQIIKTLGEIETQMRISKVEQSNIKSQPVVINVEMPNHFTEVKAHVDQRIEIFKLPRLTTIIYRVFSTTK